MSLTALSQHLVALELQGASGLPYWVVDDYQSEFETPESRVFWGRSGPETKEIWGFVFYRDIAPNEAWILHVAVGPKRQGRGRRLMQDYLADMQTRKVASVGLEVGVLNLGAQKLYESFWI